MAASQQQIQDKIGYATLLCLVTGLWQVILSVLKFGKLSWLMSEIVLSAFVTAAAFHILTSQLKSLFGIIIQRSPKLFGIVYVSFYFYFLFQIRFLIKLYLNQIYIITPGSTIEGEISTILLNFLQPRVACFACLRLSHP